MLGLVIGMLAGIIVVSMIELWRAYKSARFAAAVEAEDARLDWLESQARDEDEAYDLENMA